MPPDNVEIPATCRGMSSHIYVYVADSAWEDNMVNQEMIDDIVYAWDTATPSNNEMGIYELSTSIFGEPPDVDNDEHIIIFITPLGSYNGHTFDGYFKRENQTPGTYSNLAEMIYLDCEYNAPNSDYLLGVLAHEFQHMLQYNADSTEESWLDETFSQAAMFMTGYWSDLSTGNNYLLNRHATSPLVVADPRNYDYGAGFMFAAYTVDRFSASFYADLSQSQTKRVSSVNEILDLQNLNNQYDFFSLILDWATASLLNDENIGDGNFVYLTLRDEISTPSPTMGQVGQSYNVNLPLSAYYYLSYQLSAGEEIDINISDGDNLIARTIYYTSSSTEVEDIDLQSGTLLFTAPDDGVLTLILLRVSGEGSISIEAQ